VRSETMAWGLPPHATRLRKSAIDRELDEPVQQATDIEMTDIGADADRGRRGNRGVDAAGSGETGRGKIDARAGFDHRAVIERVRQIHGTAGAGSCAAAGTCTAGKRAGGGSEQAIDSTKQVSD